MRPLPRLYAIVDAQTLADRESDVRSFSLELAAAGVRLVQLRDKAGAPGRTLEWAATMRECLPGATLVMNDRADLCALAGFEGVHVGQGDLAVADALQVLQARAGFVGVSTHTEEQVRAADLTDAAYVAIGPVFRTSTKQDAAAVVGLAGVRRARELTTKPLVAIGGITRENCASVIEAGADAVAVISGLFGQPGETVAEVCREFLKILGG